MKKLAYLFASLFMVAVIGSCSLMDNLNPDVPEVTPNATLGVNMGGNVTCCEVAEEYDVEFAFSSGKRDWNLNELGEYVFGDAEEFESCNEWPVEIEIDPETGWPVGLEVTVTNGTFVSFIYESANYCVGAVIVKGGPSANVYYYDGGIKSDEGLAAPTFVNAKRKVIQPGLSNLTFCFVECDNGNGECGEQTAWGGATEGSGSAWWFYYDASIGGSQTIWAGQHYNAGTVEVVDGIVNITLTDDWELQSVAETVKIQGYNTIPTSRPAAGQFDYKGTDLTGIYVGAYAFYAIHLDVVLPCL